MCLAEGREERKLPDLVSQPCVIKGRWGIARRKRTAGKGGEVGRREPIPGSGPLTVMRMLTFMHIQKNKSVKRHSMEGQKSAFTCFLFSYCKATVAGTFDLRGHPTKGFEIGDSVMVRSTSKGIPLPRLFKMESLVETFHRVLKSMKTLGWLCVSVEVILCL